MYLTTSATRLKTKQISAYLDQLMKKQLWNPLHKDGTPRETEQKKQNHKVTSSFELSMAVVLIVQHNYKCLSLVFLIYFC